jgi:hypothetical protein
LGRELESMVPRVQQVMRQTKARSLPVTPCRGQDRQFISLFKPSTEVIQLFCGCVFRFSCAITRNVLLFARDMLLS